jgi:hypothetical protein
MATKYTYPRDGKELVINIYLLGDTEVTATVFPQYPMQGTSYRSAAYTLSSAMPSELTNGLLIGLPAGDVADSRLDIARINPVFIIKAGKPKWVNVPDDIKTNIDTFYELVDSTDPLTGDQEVQLKQVRIKLDNYFNTSRRFSIEG